MDTIFEKSISTNPKCHSCGGLVYALEKKKTTNHAYHIQCFRCRICKRSLNESSLNEERDDIYCANCYRKKQRGDCNSMEFRRAAAEKAQYIHNEHHHESTTPVATPRTPIQRDFQRRPSWVLHQIERKSLSNYEDSLKDAERIDETLEEEFSTSYPTTIKSNVLIPINGKGERYSSKTTENLTQSPNYPPVFSPDVGSIFSFNLANSAISTKITSDVSNGLDKTKIHGETTEQAPKTTHNNTQTQFKKWPNNLSTVLPSTTQPNHSSIMDVNRTTAYADGKQNIFFFPDIRPTSTHRRTKSAHHTRKQYKK